MYDPTSDPDGEEQHPPTRDEIERLVEEERREMQAADDAERDEMAACARLEDEARERNSFARIATMLRDTIDRQIATVPEGKFLNEKHGEALARLVTNIVGNLTYTVSFLINEAGDGVDGNERA